MILRIQSYQFLGPFYVHILNNDIIKEYTITCVELLHDLSPLKLKINSIKNNE